MSFNNGNMPAVLMQAVDKDVDLGERQLHVIKGVTLDVPRGQMLGIVGPSGSGKSTLIGLIGGLDTPTRGQVWLDGVDISHMGEGPLTTIRNQKIGFVFQFFHLIPTLNAIQNVALPIRFAELPAHSPNERAKELLHLLGLGDRMKHRPSQLSGGQQQRVAIARALANDPPILLCDEPTGNLDVETGKRLMETLHDIRERMQTTVIVVTHDLMVAREMDRVVTLIDGKITEDSVLA
jgi:putative ABC transport system ATP-binding protein